MKTKVIYIFTGTDGDLHKKCYLVDNALDEQFNLTQILSPKMGEDIQAQMKFVDKHTPPNLEPPPIDPVAAQSMSLQDLIRPVEPPHFVPKDKDWAKLEKQGWLFPDDYKRFIESYGGGYFGVFGLSIWSPFAKHPHFNLLKQFEDTEKELSDVARDWDRTCFKIFPEDEGRFWFGYKDGTYLCWTCSGKPADWKVAVDGVCDDDIHSFEIGFEELMTGLLSTPSFADKHLCDLVGSRTYQVTN